MWVLAMALAGQLASLPACRPTQLRMRLDAKDGNFNGMSHSGTRVVLRNQGVTCQLPALPLVEFRDARGRLVAARRRAPTGMHPGPAMVSVRLARGEQATTDIRWVSGPVYPSSRKATAASLIVHVAAGAVRTPIAADLYGERGKSIAFEQTALRLGAP